MPVTNESDDDHLVIAALCVLFPAFRERIGMNTSSCIWSTRVGIEVLHYFGISAEPMPVAVQVHCPVTVGLMDRGIDLTDAAAVARHGGHTLGTDPDAKPTKPGGWNCHLIAYAPGANRFIDLSVEQYSRPEHGIDLYPMPVEPIPTFWDGAWIRYDVGGARVLYRHRPDQTGYRDARDWTWPKRRRADAGILIRTMRKTLDKEG